MWKCCSGILGRTGFSVARVPVPVKLLAVRSGLAEYGRNNLAYVRGLGSQVRWTHSPPTPTWFRCPANWSPVRRMDACGPAMPVSACPTGCIP